MVMSLPKMPSEYVPRLEKFLEKLKNKEIPETKLMELFEAVIRPALKKALENPEIKGNIEKQIEAIIGKKLFIQMQGLNPWLIEVKPLPEVIKFSISTEENVKRESLPGVTYDFSVTKDIMMGTLNPVKALLTGKIKITGMMELTKWGMPLLSILGQITGKRSEAEGTTFDSMLVLDKLMKEAGC
jgi:hypothetical protein